MPRPPNNDRTRNNRTSPSPISRECVSAKRVGTVDSPEECAQDSRFPDFSTVDSQWASMDRTRAGTETTVSGGRAGSDKPIMAGTS